MSWVYILSSAKGRYYVGSTSNIKRRLQQHRQGHTQTTRRMGESKLVFQQQFHSLADARKAERRLKNLKRRDYIEKIVQNGRIDFRP